MNSPVVPPGDACSSWDGAVVPVLVPVAHHEVVLAAPRLTPFLRVAGVVRVRRGTHHFLYEAGKEGEEGGVGRRGGRRGEVGRTWEVRMEG